jgi:hypothetical protein
LAIVIDILSIDIMLSIFIDCNVLPEIVLVIVDDGRLHDIDKLPSIVYYIGGVIIIYLVLLLLGSSRLVTALVLIYI